MSHNNSFATLRKLSRWRSGLFSGFLMIDIFHYKQALAVILECMFFSIFCFPMPDWLLKKLPKPNGRFIKKDVLYFRERFYLRQKD